MRIIQFQHLENKLIQINHELILLDKDVTKFYSIKLKKLQQQLKRNKV
jgi:hypothetical protein